MSEQKAEVVEIVEAVENKEILEAKDVSENNEHSEVIEIKDKTAEIVEFPVAEKSPSECIFITEDDTFDIRVRWYKIDDELFVYESDTDFDKDMEGMNEFTVTFKYPSQGDYELIMNSTVYRSPDEMKIADVIQMELTRLVTLVRRWSLPQDMSRMVEMDPLIIKSLLKQIRDKIGMKGIL